MGKFLFVWGILAVSMQGWASERMPIDIDFYGSRSDYAWLDQLYEQNKMQLLSLGNGTPQRDLDEVVELGRRNLRWLDHLNQYREKPLSFSSKETQKGIPIDEPKVYGPSTIFPEQTEIIGGLPEQMHRILVAGEDFENSLDITDDEYIQWGRRLDRLYQTTVRWLTLSGWKHYYAERKAHDVRGFYFLKQRQNLQQELQNFNELDEETQQWLTPLLVNICENSVALWRRCPNLFAEAVSTHSVYEFYQSHIEGAKQRYNGFFKLDVRRRDTRWDSDGEMRFPFRTPKDQDVKVWLVENIEDEWRWGDWRLTLNFSKSAGPRVVFRPNVTPNVNGLGGNVITMNSLNSLDDYNTRWTIRHEFGHVLGFPDCYVEFYDETKNVMINYQIDVTNLMCSRRGELQETHHSELKRVHKRSVNKKP